MRTVTCCEPLSKVPLLRSRDVLNERRYRFRAAHTRRYLGSATRRLACNIDPAEEHEQEDEKCS